MNGKIGLTELIFILAIVLLIFGPSKIGQLGKSLGEGIPFYLYWKRSNRKTHNTQARTHSSQGS